MKEELGNKTFLIYKFVKSSVHFSTVVGATIKCKKYNGITVESGTPVKSVNCEYVFKPSAGTVNYKNVYKIGNNVFIKSHLNFLHLDLKTRIFCVIVYDMNIATSKRIWLHSKVHIF